MIYTSIESIIGHTPLLQIDAERYGIVHTNVYVKLEYLNPFGSIKDRTAVGLLSNASMDDLKTHDKHIIESSSGNTAKALQILAARHGVPFTSVTNRIKVPEVEQQLRYFGTTIVSLPGRSECPDPNDSGNAIATINAMITASPDRYHHTSQYENRDNTLIHQHTTAAEIYDDLSIVDHVVTGVGTGGSSGGLIEYAKAHRSAAKHVGVVAHPSDFLPGIRTKNELFETELFNEDDFNDILEVTSTDALEALRDLVLNEGILAGPTTGANFAASLRYLQSHDVPRKNGDKQSLVFVACDRIEPYMSYIMKRQPDLFGTHTYSDLYSIDLTTIDVDALRKPANAQTQDWIEQSRALVIDTRGVKPFANFHIPGSISYPEEMLREILSLGAPFDRDVPLLFVCPIGERSDILAAILRQRGYDAYGLEGGLLSWRTNGLPLVRKRDIDG